MSIFSIMLNNNYYSQHTHSTNRGSYQQPGTTGTVTTNTSSGNSQNITLPETNRSSDQQRGTTEPVTTNTSGGCACS